MKRELYNLNTGACGMELTTPFSFLTTFIFSIKFLYYFISFPPIFRFVPISIQSYDNSSLQVSVLDSYYYTRVEGRHMQSAFTTNINTANSHLPPQFIECGWISMKLSGAYYCQTMDLYLSIINFVAVVIHLTTP